MVQLVITSSLWKALAGKFWGIKHYYVFLNLKTDFFNIWCFYERFFIQKIFNMVQFVITSSLRKAPVGKFWGIKHDYVFFITDLTD